LRTNILRVVAAAGLVVAAGWLSPALAQSGERYALLVQGASGEEQYAKLHREWLDSLAGLLRDSFRYDPKHLIVLAERPKPGEQTSNAEGVRTSLAGLAGLSTNDQLIVVLIGHGTAQGGDPKFNLLGPDLTVAEWKKLLAPIKARIAVVATSSASFPFLTELSAPGRVIISATNSPAQRFHTLFPQQFVAAFKDPESDLDKDSRVSLMEAFTYASRAVASHYQQKGMMATENAMIDDDGDGVGHLATAPAPDGKVAALTYFSGIAVATSADPETQRLLARQQQLTEQVDELRRRQGAMPKAEYDKQFEQLMVDLAQVSAEVRKRSPSK
jgi:hypothetical protein